VETNCRYASQRYWPWTWLYTGTPRTPRGGTIGTLRAPTRRKRCGWGGKYKWQSVERQGWRKQRERQFRASSMERFSKAMQNPKRPGHFVQRRARNSALGRRVGSLGATEGRPTSYEATSARTEGRLTIGGQLPGTGEQFCAPLSPPPSAPAYKKRMDLKWPPIGMDLKCPDDTEMSRRYGNGPEMVRR